MSVMDTVLHRKETKVLLALAIPVGLAYFFYSANQKALEEIKKANINEAKNPTVSEITVDNYRIEEVDDSNKPNWLLTAKKGIKGDGDDEKLIDVDVKFFDGANVKMHLAAPYGIAHQTTHYVKLSSGNGMKVIAEGQDGKVKLETGTLELKEKNQFIATGGVNIEWPQIARVSGDQATGNINISDLKDFKISGNTHAEIFTK